MKKTIQLAALLALATLSMGCAPWRAKQFADESKTLTIEASDIVFRGIRDGALRFDVPLRLENHSDGELRVKRLQLSASVGGKEVFSACRDQQLTIEPHGEHIITMPFAIDVANLARGMLQGSPTFTFSGQAIVDIGVLGERVASFSAERKVFSPTRPHLGLDSVSLEKSSLSTLRLTIRFNRNHRPGDKVLMSSLAGTVSHASSQADSGPMEAVVSIPTVSALRVMRQIAKARKCSMKLEVAYEADTKNMKYRIPYVFERTDIPLPWKKKEAE